MEDTVESTATIITSVIGFGEVMEKAKVPQLTMRIYIDGNMMNWVLCRSLFSELQDFGLSYFRFNSFDCF